MKRLSEVWGEIEMHKGERETKHASIHLRHSFRGSISDSCILISIVPSEMCSSLWADCRFKTTTLIYKIKLTPLPHVSDTE